MRIAAVGRALPDHYYDQETLLEALKTHWAGRYHNLSRLEKLHRNVQVGGRHLAVPIDVYQSLDSWGEANAHWIDVAQDVGERAIRDGLAQVGLEPKDVDAIFFVTVTGVATPSIDARLCNRLGFRSDIKRTPIFGLGCVAGAAGVARAADYVRAFPDHVAVLLSVELCSLTLQPKDLSIPNLIATGLFGDGAAAAVVVGEERAQRLGIKGPRVVDTRSVFYPDTEGVMGWDIGDWGFRIVLSAEVPDIAKGRLSRDVAGFLESKGLSVPDIGVWVCHPGGPKVLLSIEEGLQLPDGALHRTWRSLEEVGNLSSSSVLFVLADTLKEHKPTGPNEPGLLLAMGPGFCSELVLWEWGE